MVLFQNFSNLITRNIFKNNLIQKCHFDSISSTIFALSTNIKSSGSAIAVIRVSGQETLNVIDVITNGKSSIHRANPRKSFVHNFYDPKTKEVIDHGMILWFPKPKSYTGEDVCEFHIHGSPAVISKMLTILGELNDCRPAEKGEFTKRALMNGKLQMIQAEGIRDLINAKTDNQRRRALSGLAGVLDQKFNEWRQNIVKLLAHIEAFIDFSEEELIGQEVIVEWKENIQKVQDQIIEHINKTKLKSDLIKDGFHIAIIGPANVGKSSLINKLSEKEISIISPVSGTTRDIVETWMDISGNCVCIADTAGIKDSSQTTDIVELQGIKKAIQRAKECHLILIVLDASILFHHKKLILPSHLTEIITGRPESEVLFIVNKIDLLNDDREWQELKEILLANRIRNSILISCLNNHGFNSLINHLKTKIEDVCIESSDELPFSNDRHVMHLKEAVKELKLSLDKIDIDMAISSFHLRQAAYHLGCLTGHVTTEHILDVIFKDFCIGK